MKICSGCAAPPSLNSLGHSAGRNGSCLFFLTCAHRTIFFLHLSPIPPIGATSRAPLAPLLIAEQSSMSQRQCSYIHANTSAPRCATDVHLASLLRRCNACSHFFIQRALQQHRKALSPISLCLEAQSVTA